MRIRRSTAEVLQQIASELRYDTLSQLLRHAIEDFSSRTRQKVDAAGPRILEENLSDGGMDPLDELVERLSKDCERL